MSNGLMYTQMGLRGLQTLGNHMTTRHSATMRQMQVDYMNAMSAFSAAQSLNTQTANEISVRDAAVNASAAIQLQSMADKATATVSAAAAGVEGGSVNAAMRGLSRSKLKAQTALKRKMEGQTRANTDARRGIGINTAMNRDTTVIPQPSAASALLGLGAGLIEVYDEHQPEGSKTTDAMAKWWQS